MTTEKYPIIMRILHWLMALLIIGLLCLGFMFERLPEDADYMLSLYKLHKSFGVVALILIIVRLAVRLSQTIPPLPEALSSTEKLVAHWAHRILYLGMVIMPLSGFIMSSATPERYGVELFGWRLPDLPPSQIVSDVAHSMHGLFAWPLALLILVHIAGVIKHRWFDKNGTDVLPRMLK